jgi:hypothetical protein
VYVWAFAQPLYIPSDHVVLSYGKRLGTRSRCWELDEKTPATVLDELGTLLEFDGMEFLRQRATPALLADAYRWQALVRKDPHVRQVVAFSFVKAKKRGPALRLLNRLRQASREAPEWEQMIASQSEMLLRALEHGSNEGDDLLAEWEAQTRQSLKLPQ